MTKTALIIIAVLLIIPVIIGFHYYREWKANNIVVAYYGDTVDEVKYGTDVLKRVAGSENYTFRKGEYLGKIENRLFGSQLYRVDGDADGSYYAVAGNEGLVLMNETGTMTDGMRGKNSRVTRIVLGDYRGLTEDTDEIALITETVTGDPFRVKPDDYKTGELTFFEIRLFLDGSAVSTETSGGFYYLTEKNKWVFVGSEELSPAETEEETAQAETDGLNYSGTEVGNPALIRLLKRMVFPETEEQPAGTSAAG